MNVESKKKVGRPLRADPIITNLINTWIEVVTREGTLAESLALMNKTLDVKVTHSRLRDWEKAKRSPSPIIINYMMQMVISDLLKQLEIDSKKLNEILAKIYIPK